MDQSHGAKLNVPSSFCTLQNASPLTESVVSAFAVSTSSSHVVGTLLPAAVSISSL